MSNLRRGIVQFLRSEDGPTAAEYAVLLAIIACGVLVAMGAFGDHMDALYTSISGGVDVF